jgi:hypothetical protein
VTVGWRRAKHTRFQSWCSGVIMKGVIFVIATFLASTQSAAADVDDITIACEGVKNSTEAVGFGANSQILTAPRSSAAIVIFKLKDGVAQVKLSATLWASKGDGWFPVTDLEVGTGAIKGRVPLGTFTKPRIQIDRMNGTIDMSSSSYMGSSFTFSGSCQPFNESARRF